MGVTGLPPARAVVQRLTAIFRSRYPQLEDPEHTPPPEGYQAPFYKVDREAEMRAAHAHFQARLDAEIAGGRWTPPVRERAKA
jgi:hypothetical protein